MNEKQRTIRIDINASNPVAGKTTLAAVIANAVKNTFPDQHVEVLAQENDFLTRAQDLALGHVKLHADVVQIVDINANPPPLREGALFSTTIVDIQELSQDEFWLPIEAAPTDGTSIVAYDEDDPEGGAHVARWTDGAWRYAGDEYTFTPTVWQPLQLPNRTKVTSR